MVRTTSLTTFSSTVKGILVPWTSEHVELVARFKVHKVSGRFAVCWALGMQSPGLQDLVNGMKAYRLDTLGFVVWNSGIGCGLWGSSSEWH